jgi:hypothetical protein
MNHDPQCSLARGSLTAIQGSFKNKGCGPPYDLLSDNANARAEAIIDYLRHLKAHLAGPMTILWDGNPIQRPFPGWCVPFWRIIRRSKRYV